MLSILALGMLIGLQHALEADHVAAVASLATRSKNIRQTMRQGAVWGMGHTLTLLLFGGAVLAMGSTVPEHLASGLEMAVGVLLILLGADVLRRLWRNKVHFHTHSHDGDTHIHAHSHHRDGDHGNDPHQHSHPKGFPLRSLLVGMMHGMAGSAALIVLALQTVESVWMGLAYILIFGLGSVIGMAMLGAVIGLNLQFFARHLTFAHNSLQIAVGSLTIGLGAYIVYEIGPSGIGLV